MKQALLLVLALVAVLLLVVLYNLFQPAAPVRRLPEVAYSDLVQAVDAGRVRDVTIADQALTGHMDDGRAFETALPQDPTLVPRLLQKNVNVRARAAEPPGGLAHLLLSWLPLVTLVGLWFWFLHHVRRALAVVARAVEALPAAVAARDR